MALNLAPPSVTVRPAHRACIVKVKGTLHQRVTVQVDGTVRAELLIPTHLRIRSPVETAPLDTIVQKVCKKLTLDIDGLEQDCVNSSPLDMLSYFI